MNFKFCSLAVGFLILTGISAGAQESTAGSADEVAQVRNAIASYIAAFNARDAQKLASHWSVDGVYTNRSTGEESVGRDAIAAEFGRIFLEAQVPKLAVATESIQLVSPNVALEKGMATVTHAGDAPVETKYSVVYVKSNGKWLIDRVSEESVDSATSHYDQLKALEWMIGDWVMEDENFRVETSSRWTANQNFISRKFKVMTNEEVASSGLQIIGWDAKDKIIRSWLFDSNGGIVTGVWNKAGDGWSVQSVATLADGAAGSFTAKFRSIDDDTYGWQKINRVLDSELLPNIDEIMVRRD